MHTRLKSGMLSEGELISGTLFPDEPDTVLVDTMSTIKKHLISDSKHVLPTYKKLPPIQSPPPPYSGLTITKLNNTKLDSGQTDDTVPQITSTTNQKVVLENKTVIQQNGDDSSGVTLIGYKSLDGQKKAYVPPGSELPPCRICGEKASGLHYGVNTCEACKAFFRRTLKKSSVDFHCMCSAADRKRNLEDPPRKTSCPKCRYDRCIREGMSKDAIKIGRYTINRKRQNDREVNMLKEQGGVVGRRISEGSPKSSSSSADSPASTVSQKVFSPEVMSPDTTTKPEGEESNQGVANKRMKTNDGQALAKGLFESLTNSLFQSLMQNQDSPVLKGGNSGSTEGLSPLEKLYMEPFEAKNSNGQYKTTIQVGKDSQNVVPVTGSQIQQIQKGGQFIQPVNTSTTLPKQVLITQSNHRQNMVNSGQAQLSHGQNMVFQGQTLPNNGQNIVISGQTLSNSGQNMVIHGQTLSNPGQNMVISGQLLSNNGQNMAVPGQNLFVGDITGSNVNPSVSVTNSQEKSLIETLFEANGTVPVQNENSMMENLFRDPGFIQTHAVKGTQPNSAPSISVHQTHSQVNSVPASHTQPQPSVYPDKHISNFSTTDETLDQILADEGLLKSMEDFSEVNENSLGSFADSFNLSDEVIASKLKSMEAHTMENDSFIATKLKSMEEQDFDEGGLGLVNGNLMENESELIVTKLESMSKQLNEDMKNEAVQNGEVPVLTGSELTEFEMYQPQIGAPSQNVDPEHTDELKEICTTMIDTALASYVCPLKLSCEEIKERHKKYLEQYVLKTKVFGDMNNIPQDEYLEFYNQTGIDIDNRQEILIEYLRYAEQCISELVTFSKVIPGFTALPLDDQVTLLKAGRFSTFMIKDGLYGGRCQATALQVATMPWNKEYHFDELKKVAPLKLFDMKATIYEKVFEIGMTAEESILVKAMAITYPKNEELIAPDKVEAIHNKMTECLLFQLQKRKTGKKPSLTSIFELLFYLREQSVIEQQYMMEMFETWPLTNNHQLLKEFVS